jgi:3-hydroxyisobutyrate dehydrogenase
MRLGFIGLGNIGAGIARDVASSGHTLTVFDLRPEAMAELAALGAQTASSSAKVAASSDIVGICVRTDDDVREVVCGPNGLLAGARPGLILAIHSTIHLSTLEELHAAAEEKGVRVVDAPISRGTNAPRTKAIVFMLGGAPQDVVQVVPYVSLAALKVVRTGKLGSALILKLCNNLITYLMTVTLRDAFRLCSAGEVDLRQLEEVVSSNGVGSPNMLFSIRHRAGLKTQVQHTVDTAEVNAALGEKDLSCALDAASHLGVKLPAVEMARGEIRDTIFEILG